jgi:hypothetical protein
LAGYLKKQAKSIENYDSVDIFSLAIEDRILRIAILGADSVAASNVEDASVIRGIVDRSRKLASPFGGAAVLRRFYKRVQFSSPLWLVAHIDPESPMFGGWNSFLAHPADLVVSAGYIPLRLQLHPNALHVRAEALTGSPDEAHAVYAAASTYLATFNSAENAVGARGNDSDVKAMFDSLQIKQEGDRAILNAAVPYGFLKKMLSDSAADMPAASPTQAPANSR